jgi:hypothetical protein
MRALKGSFSKEKPIDINAAAMGGFVSLHVFILTSEVSVVGASTSLTMGCHYGPSADWLVLVCVSAFPFGITVQGGLM